MVSDQQRQKNKPAMAKLECASVNQQPPPPKASRLIVVSFIFLFVDYSFAHIHTHTTWGARTHTFSCTTNSARSSTMFAPLLEFQPNPTSPARYAPNVQRMCITMHLLPIPAVGWGCETWPTCIRFVSYRFVNMAHRAKVCLRLQNDAVRNIDCGGSGGTEGEEGVWLNTVKMHIFWVEIAHGHRRYRGVD